MVLPLAIRLAQDPFERLLNRLLLLGSQRGRRRRRSTASGFAPTFTS